MLSVVISHENWPVVVVLAGYLSRLCEISSVFTKSESEQASEQAAVESLAGASWNQLPQHDFLHSTTYRHQ